MRLENYLLGNYTWLTSCSSLKGGEGPFQHQCILNTFALFLEITEHLPIEYRQIGHGGFPRAALALATAAVSSVLHGIRFANKPWVST